MGDPHISFLWPRRPFGHLSPPRHFIGTNHEHIKRRKTT
nr:MAG TPA: hypothetical protein [Caudoviricetes sp.]